MGGSVSSQRMSSSDHNCSLTLLLRRATVHSLASSAGKRSAAMGTRNSATAVRCWRTVSRKKAQVRKREATELRSSLGVLRVASLSSHDAGRPISEVGVGGGAIWSLWGRQGAPEMHMCTSSVCVHSLVLLPAWHGAVGRTREGGHPLPAHSRTSPGGQARH